MRKIEAVVTIVAIAACARRPEAFKLSCGRDFVHQPGRIMRQEILRAKLEDYSAYDAIVRIDPLMLVQRPNGLNSPSLVVMIDGNPFDVGVLRDLSARDIDAVERGHAGEVYERARSVGGFADLLVIRTRHGGC